MFESLAAESLAPTACTTIEEVGSTGVGALTVSFLILLVSTIVFIARAGSAGETKKYYYCSVFICGFATLSYFAMLSGQGWTAIAGCRQFFYIRYFEYAITMPLIILQLGLVAGCDASDIAATIGVEVLGVFCAYMGAVSVVTTVKWFWFVISLIALVIVLMGLAKSFKEAANARGGEIASLYGQLGALIIITFILYPVNSSPAHNSSLAPSLPRFLLHNPLPWLGPPFSFPLLFRRAANLSPQAMLLQAS
eukprot:3546990-Rhodomonas_salina.1